ncbi:aminoglycoside phosphotransferase [Roseobacter cerasinus]|uniref:Aminoglycoside phosphotransferase n=1 Tax=Roseobacter cerasinus TaxID=2602289 RepID=A0A640VR63_9RHOB|nr:phosphotransferase [Roseobacter cerasinus]GFE49375.1 aminoglycoside phosphotransferase [Roseobacter cerasinus]
MKTRAAMLDSFLTQAGWGAARYSPLAGDASKRRYDRLTGKAGARAILMDAPPETGEDVRPFARIARHLLGLGLSAPQIMAQDDTRGFLLLEDLGDDLFARLMETDPVLEPQLYAAAVDVLTHLHKTTPPPLPIFDATQAAEWIAPAFDWYQFGATGAVDMAAKARVRGILRALLEPLDAQPRVLIQRDYHSENLLWLPDRDGPACVGLLDFQDALQGHRAYDLVSLLQDARRDVSSDMEATMIHRYLEQTGQDAETFRTAYAVLGTQRNLRIIGIFARLCLRDGKAHYIDMIPRVWRHIERNLNHPALHELAVEIAQTLPRPAADILTELREQCATCPNR